MHGYKSVITDEFVMGMNVKLHLIKVVVQNSEQVFNDKEMMKIAKKYDFVYPENDYEVLKI